MGQGFTKLQKLGLTGLVSTAGIGGLMAFAQQNENAAAPAIVEGQPSSTLPDPALASIPLPKVTTGINYAAAKPQKPADRAAPPPKTLEQRLFEFLKEAEGCKYEAYTCTAGKRTIGIGFNLDDIANQALFCEVLNVDLNYLNTVRAGEKTLTDPQVQKLFQASVAEARRIVDTRFKEVPLKDHQYIALVSLAFNSPKLIGPNLTRYVKAQDWSAATYEILHNSNRTQHKGLQNRRNKEAMMFSGFTTMAETENFAARLHSANYDDAPDDLSKISAYKISDFTRAFVVQAKVRVG